MSTTLDLTQLDTLLKLPCNISDTCNFLEVAIFAKAEEISSGVFVHKINIGETIEDFLDRIYEGKKKI